MSSLGKINNSLLTGVNENNVALFSLNLDFSLVKLEAPQAFAPVGSALTKRRRDNAEDGESHQVARRLGALFEQVMPSTPKLITAYGVRASEIVQTPGINPKGSKADGPFESYVGVDGTSIWAAATSGPASLGVLLLAYMLARKFDDAKMSTAIWVELVCDRQLEIGAAIKNNEVVSASSMIAARQAITREQIANFDASARAWLGSADQAKMSEQKRLMLILKNIEIPVSDGRSTYRKVVDAWKKAMIGLENLLCGMPHEISDGAILLALSAWHLYPDLVVLSSEVKNVSFKDPLFPQGGVVTVGLRPESMEDTTGIKWSLTLSHLRYYGDAVLIESTEQNSRVTMDQLGLVALGAVLACWNIGQDDLLQSAEWFHEIGALLKKPVLGKRRPLVMELASDLDWFQELARASSKFLLSKGEERETCRMLVNFGRRRRATLLGEHTNWSQPFFGLCNPFVLSALEMDFTLEHGIAYLREIAKKSGLKASETLIMYWDDASGWLPKYATAVPHERASLKRSRDNQAKTELVHARWYDFGVQKAESEVESINRISPDGHLRLRPADQLRPSGLPLEEVFYCNIDIVGSSANEWQNLPCLYTSSNTCNNRGTTTCALSPQPCRCLDHCERDAERRAIPFSVAVGDRERLALLVRLPYRGAIEHDTVDIVKEIAQTNQKEHIYLVESRVKLSNSFDSHKKLIDYFECLARHQGYAQGYRHGERGEWFQADLDERTGNESEEQSADESEEDGGLLNQKAEKYRHPPKWRVISSGSYRRYSVLKAMQISQLPGIPWTYLSSLFALSIASSLYRPFSAVTFPLKISSVPLHTAKWLPKVIGVTVPSPKPPISRLSRAEIFSCIAMFESGGLNIDKEVFQRVMALSAGNSIFVAGSMLSDPSQPIFSWDIRHIVGNIGSPGIALLVPPESPRMMSVSNNYDYRVVAHQEYDHKREDNFKGTTLHLSFTGWKIPVATGTHGLIDQDIFLQEAVVSVRDRGRWIADLDILSDLPNFFQMLGLDCRCREYGKEPEQKPMYTYTSIDSWDEIFDELPEKTGIVRAKDNFAARLAAVCVLRRMGPPSKVGLLVGPIECWRCLEQDLVDDGYHIVVD